MIDERVVVGLDEEGWEETDAAELDADVAALHASREIHAWQAETLLRESEGEDVDYENYIPVVIQPKRTFESGS